MKKKAIIFGTILSLMTMAVRTQQLSYISTEPGSIAFAVNVGQASGDSCTVQLLWDQQIPPSVTHYTLYLMDSIGDTIRTIATVPGDQRSHTTMWPSYGQTEYWGLQAVNPYGMSNILIVSDVMTDRRKPFDPTNFRTIIGC